MIFQLWNIIVRSRGSPESMFIVDNELGLVKDPSGSDPGK